MSHSSLGQPLGKYMCLPTLSNVVGRSVEDLVRGSVWIPLTPVIKTLLLDHLFGVLFIIFRRQDDKTNFFRKFRP